MSNDFVECAICGARVHAIQLHLRDHHPELSLDDYKAKFPGAPVLSRIAQEKIAAHQATTRKKEEPVVSAHAQVVPLHKATRKPFHEIFGINSAIPGALNGKGEPIPITVLDESAADGDMIPTVDKNHVWDPEFAKDICMAFELNIPLYIWGHAGTGKTTDYEQVCAVTRRPMIRVQHTINTEEAHIIGQWVAVKGETRFQPGPLPMAMRYGWAYLADEYDFALPSVLAVYQPVLEGKSLVIKDADPEWRIVKPHKTFRFGATGNTNGSGDDTGLYQGTTIQNAANYDRFGMTLHKLYMKPEMEAEVVAKQANINIKDAKKLVELATMIRENFDGGKMSSTISPRALINSARIGLMKASWRAGLARAYTNKLNRVDREVVEQTMQRVFG